MVVLRLEHERMRNRGARVVVLEPDHAQCDRFDDELKAWAVALRRDNAQRAVDERTPRLERRTGRCRMSLDRLPFAAKGGSPMTRPTVVLVHGLGGSAEAWSRVVPFLDRAEIPHVSVDLPSCGPPGDVDDAELLRSVLDACDDRVVLVAHSAGGMAITEVGSHPSVKHLVYLDAAMPDVGESLFVLQADGFSDGLVECFRLDADGGEWDADALAGYLLGRGWSSDDAREFTSTSRPQRMAPLVETSTVSAWRSVPSTFISCADSEMSAQLRQFFGSRATYVVEMPGDHFPLWVRPEEVADVLVRIADEVSTA